MANTLIQDSVLGSLLGAFRGPSGLPGRLGGCNGGARQGPLGILGVPLGAFWGCLGCALWMLVAPGGSLGAPRAISGFIWEIMGPLRAPFWDPFGAFFRLVGSVRFSIVF